MAAVSAVILAFCDSGDNYVATSPIYGGTHTLGVKILPRFQIEAREIKCTDIAAIEAAIDDRTKLLLVETPANPNISICDLEACVALARKYNLILAVDNTFATPYLQQPLKLGADIAIHSATKYISGHGDTVAGLVISPSSTILEE